jgi:hypothetical protein
LWAGQPQNCFGACERNNISPIQSDQLRHADAQALAFRTASFIQENHIKLDPATRVIAVEATLPASPAAPDRAVINPPVVRNTASEGSSDPNPMPSLLIMMGFGLIGLRLIVSYRARKAKNSSS